MSNFYKTLTRSCCAATAMLVCGSAMLFAQAAPAPTNFGTVAVGGTSQQNVTFTGMPSGVSFSVYNGTDFSIAAAGSCSGTCAIPVTFRPSNPGLRQGAITASNQSGLLAVADLYGTGTAPQIAVSPGVITTLANRAATVLVSAVLSGEVVGTGYTIVSNSSGNAVYSVNLTSGAITAYAGNGTAGYTGDGGAATSATLHTPTALAFDALGDLYIADTGNNAVRRVDAFTGNISTVAGTGAAGNGGDGGAATSSQLNSPMGLALDSSGNLYIADTGNNRIREVMAVNGQITTASTIVNFAGNSGGAAGFSGDGGAATGATLNGPTGIGLDASGNLFIADTNNSVIREVSGGTISTVAGTPNSAGFGGDGGAATSALLSGPTGVAVDAAGDLYIADKGNNRIREVSGNSHNITTVAGAGTAGYSGDAGAATTADLNAPSMVAVDGSGNLFIIDSGNFALREVTATPAPVTFSGVSSTTLTVWNTGNANLNLSALNVTGPYTISGGTCTSSTSLAAGQTCTIALSYPGGTVSAGATLSITDNSLNQSGVTQSASLNLSAGLHFVAVTPCRVVDTRNSNDSFSGTSLTAGSTRTYIIAQSPNINSTNCPGVTIPSNAQAFSMNIAVVPHNTPLSFLTMWPTGQTQPLESVLNSDGRIKSNAAIVGTGTNGSISVFATNATDLILDVDGYFVSDTSNADMEFYPMTPCRVIDTRSPSGSLGGPSLGTHGSRDFPILQSACATNIPSNVKAYSFNIAAVPTNGHSLAYLTAWPTGASQPVSAVLNDDTGAITSNAAIVPAGTSGNVSIYSSDPTDVVVDINGYFAPASSSGLSLYTAAPCRVLDTRSPNTAGAFTGTINVDFVTSACSVPTGAQAYVVGVAVVPESSLSYLTLWPAGTAEPLAATLNADDKAITSNMAIVPTSNGSISAYASSSTYLVLDLFAYFAP